jgi:hypothetical protein
MGVSVDTLRRMRERGVGPAYYRLPGGAGERVRYKAGEVRAYVESFRVETAPA